LATKYDLPNASGSSSNLTSEMTEYERLYKLKPRTQIGNISFTSLTSGTTYLTATYSSGAYANTGEQGMLNVLKDVLSTYLLVAADVNAKADVTYVDGEISAIPVPTGSTLYLYNNVGGTL